MVTLMERPSAIEAARPAETEALRLALAAQAIARLADDTFFIAHTLAVCADRFAIDAEALARFLGCPPAGLLRLALSARPDPAISGFHTDIRRIALAAGADPYMLAELLELTEPVARTG